MAEWFDDDEYWRTLEPVLFTRKKLDAAPAEVDKVLALLNLAPGAAILDLPCGVGRHSIELARRGFRVTGGDRTGYYLDRARESAASAGVAVEWVKADLRTFSRPGAFDAITNLWTSFGYFEDPGDDSRVMGHFFANLRSGGRLLMDLHGKESLARRFTERQWSELEDGTKLIEYRALSQDWSWVHTQWLLLKDGKQTDVRFALRLYAATELASLARAAGFADVRCCGSLSGTPYDHTAERLVLVATRP